MLLKKVLPFSVKMLLISGNDLLKTKCLVYSLNLTFY